MNVKSNWQMKYLMVMPLTLYEERFYRSLFSINNFIVCAFTSQLTAVISLLLYLTCKPIPLSVELHFISSSLHVSGDQHHANVLASDLSLSLNFYFLCQIVSVLNTNDFKLSVLMFWHLLHLTGITTSPGSQEMADWKQTTISGLNCLLGGVLQCLKQRLFC